MRLVIILKHERARFYTVNTITRRLGPHIRRLGFKGSGQTYRRVEDDTIFVINIQLSRSRAVCYINLGAQPTFIPAECSAAFDTLKEYECVIRTRVGSDWPLNPDEQELLALAQAIDDRQRDFFGRARTLRQSLATDSPDELLDKFCAGTTREAATLLLAEAAVALGYGATAIALAEHGLERTPESASILRAELKRIRAAAVSRTPG